MKKFLFSVFVLFSTIASSQSITWSPIPGSQWANHIAGNSQQTKIYKSSFSGYGVSMSLDAGLTWTEISPWESGAPAMIVKNDTLVVPFSACNSISGIHYSTDDGQTWINMNGGGGMAYDIACTQSTIFMANSYQIKYTSDWGATWQSYSTPLNSTTGSGAYSVETDGINVVVGSTNAVYISHDDGQTWSMKSIPQSGAAWAVYISGNTIFAGMGAGLYKSIDGGNTWTQHPSFIGLNIIALEFFGSTGFIYGNLCFGTNQPGVYVTYDMGATWQTSMNWIDPNHDVWAFYQLGNGMLCGTHNEIYQGTWANSLSLSETGNSSFVVYPNPFVDDFRIDCNEQGNTFEIDLYDVQGKQIMNSMINCDDEISTSGLEPGMYFLNVKSATGEHAVKILKTAEK